MPSVLQSWVEEIPYRMQAVLVMGLRGPDTQRAPHIKKLTRWLRGLTFRPGNPMNVVEFMNVEEPERIVEKSLVHRELEFVSQHYYSHLMHALEVVGYRHPDFHIRYHALQLFGDMCRIFHLPIEPQSEFEERLKQLGWPEDANPETGIEAVKLMSRHREQLPERQRKILDGELQP